MGQLEVAHATTFFQDAWFENVLESTICHENITQLIGKIQSGNGSKK